MIKIRFLSIIVPVYNEQKTIIEVLSALKKVRIKGCKNEVIVVDDGSDDNSGKLAKQFVRRAKGFRFKKHKVNLGKGGAVRTGILAAKGDLIMVQDADLEYDPKDIPKLISPFLRSKSVDVVYGSRFLKKHKPRYRLFYWGNILLSKMTNMIYGSNITDMETGYKVFTREALNSVLPLRATGFDLEPEITAKLLKNCFKIKEVPVSYKSRAREEGKKITWKDGVKAIFYLLKYQFFD